MTFCQLKKTIRSEQRLSNFQAMHPFKTKRAQKRQKDSNFKL